MQVPLTVSFHGIPVSEPLRAACWSEAEKLERYFPDIISCHVTVEMPHRRRRSGNHYDLRLRMKVPGGEVLVSRTPTQHRTSEDATLMVRETFDEARRQLQDHVARMRGNIKTHEPAPSAPPTRPVEEPVEEAED